MKSIVYFKSRLRTIVTLLMVSSCLFTSSPKAAQQGGTARYVYDENGRLHAVISPNGEAAIYEYDAAGNFTQIRRLAADAFEIIDFAPRKGVAGDIVSFYGVGFANGTPTGSFNGASATVVQTTANLIVAIVPDNATTGPVSITNTKGTVTTSSPFTVLTGIRVTPPAVSLQQGQTAQLTAHVSGPIDHTVQWSVNGAAGGNSTVGTVSVTGLYTAPSLFFFPLVVRATVIAQPSLFSEAKVTLQAVNDNAAAPVATVSVGRSQEGATGQSVMPNAALSIGRVNPTDTQTIATPGTSISVGRLSPENAQQSVNQINSLSATTGPNITAVTPNQLTTGTTATVTVNGANFTGTTAIKILNTDRSSDSAITVTNLSVNGNGSSLTASVTVSSNATVGQRIVVIITSTGESSLGVLTTNTIQIVH